MIRRIDGEHINRKRRSLLANAAVAGVSSIALSSVSSLAATSKNSASIAASTALKPERRTITLATTNLSALPYLPCLVAQQKGFFAQQGLELEISEQQSAARAIAAVALGGADVVCGWLENVLSAPGRAAALQSFVLLGEAPMMALGVPVRTAAQDAPTNVAQLRGRKIGVVALNSPTHTVALAAIRGAGLRAADVGFVSVGSAASAAVALRSGQIDALMHMDPLMLELELRGEIKTVCNMRSPGSAYAALGMHLPSSCIAAPPEFFQRFPGTAQAVSDALVLSLQWLQRASLRDMLQLQQRFPDTAQSINPQSFVASFERLRSAYSGDGLCQQWLAQDLLTAMHDVDPALRLEKIDALKSINNTLVQQSLLRLKA